MENKFDIIEIDEKALPNVELSHNQKERLKNTLRATIKPYLENKKDNVNVDLSLQNLIKITDNLGDETDEVLNYVKGGKLLRDLVLEALDKYLPIKKEDLVYKTLLYTLKDYSFKVASIGFSNTAVAHRIYVTKDELFFYNLDSYFRVIDITKIPINYIKTAFISDKSIRDFMEFSRNTLFIEFNKLGRNDLSIPSKIILIGADGHNTPDLVAFLDILKSLGVKNFRKTKFPFGKILFWLMNISLGILFIIFLINFFSNKY